MLIESVAASTAAKKPPKEMLSVTWESDPLKGTRRPVVRINNSSLDLIQTCMRKAYYVLERGLKSNEENAAMLFGTGIHKALEVWYSVKRADRHDETLEAKAIAAFHETVAPLASSVDVGDKRSPQNGERILKNYFKKYADDPYEVLLDKEGKPYIERRAEIVLLDEPNVKIIYFGTIDVILHDVIANVTLVTDHKTTSALGTEFYNRLKPNHQYTGYTLLARKVFGLDTDSFMVNGIQVAKTKWDLARQVTTRDEDDAKELARAVYHAVLDYLSAKEVESWPMSAPNPCVMYGGCQFRDVCAASPKTRETMIEGMFKETKDAEISE